MNADGDIKTLLLDGSGDFRSNELSQYFDEADFIITNPPFSLSTELYGLIEKYKCHFIVVGSALQLHTRILLNRLRRHTLWGGGYTKIKKFFSNSNELRGGIFRWVTDINTHRPRFEFNDIPESEFKFYDGEKDIIYCKTLKDIPRNCKYTMGIPNCFCLDYDYECFEVIGVCRNLSVDGKTAFTDIHVRYR